MRVSILALVFFLTAALHAEYVKPEIMSEEDWEYVTPYLLPFDDPLREKLDSIFSHERVVENETSLGMNHFYFPYWDGGRHLIVAKHISIKDYVFKIFLDSQNVKKEWMCFVHRIRGANAILEKIASLGLNTSFKVPKKWLYLLPEGSEGSVLFVLVAENVRLLSQESNQKKWKSPKLKESILHGLCTIVHDLGLIDSVYIDNIPFCRDGKVAFVDTEHYGLPDVPYHALEKHLHSSKRELWRQLYNAL